MTTAYLNRIATAVPPHDVHDTFMRFAKSMFPDDRVRRALFRRMATKSGIEHRYSALEPAEDPNGPAIDRDAFYVRGNFPTTARRMQFFENHAPQLAASAVEKLRLGSSADRITHLLVTCCTGLSSPGLDLELSRVAAFAKRRAFDHRLHGLLCSDQRLKLARHIVRSEPDARVLIVNLEMCTLHLQETDDIEKILSFLLWGDGCAASLVTSEPEGLALDSFHAILLPDSRDLITWNVRDNGFDMVLSGQVPAAIQTALKDYAERHPRRRKSRGDRFLGGASRRQDRARCGRARLRTGADGTRCLARCLAPLRQHVFGNRYIRARVAGAAGQSRGRGLCHGLRTRPRRRDDALPRGSAVMRAWRFPAA